MPEDDPAANASSKKDHSERKVFSELQSEILFVLWEHRQLGKGRAMTATEIREAVIALRQRSSPPGANQQGGKRKQKKVAPRPGTGLANIRRNIQTLQKWNLLDDKGAQPAQKAAAQGPPPMAYAIRKDAIITWSSTARLLVELYDSPGEEQDKRQFLARMEALHIEKDGKVMSEAELENELLAFTVEKGYVEIPADSKGARITITDKTANELPFLRRIAWPMTLLR